MLPPFEIGQRVDAGWPLHVAGMTGRDAVLPVMATAATDRAEMFNRVGCRRCRDVAAGRSFGEIDAAIRAFPILRLAKDCPDLDAGQDAIG